MGSSPTWKMAWVILWLEKSEASRECQSEGSLFLWLLFGIPPPGRYQDHSPERVFTTVERRGNSTTEPQIRMEDYSWKGMFASWSHLLGNMTEHLTAICILAFFFFLPQWSLVHWPQQLQNTCPWPKTPLEKESKPHIKCWPCDHLGGWRSARGKKGERKWGNGISHPKWTYVFFRSTKVTQRVQVTTKWDGICHENTCTEYITEWLEG